VSKAMENNLLLTGEVLHQKWTKFADLAGVPDDERLSLSEGWLARFKVRNGLKQFKCHGDAASADPETMKTEQKLDCPKSGPGPAGPRSGPDP